MEGDGTASAPVENSNFHPRTPWPRIDGMRLSSGELEFSHLMGTSSSVVEVNRSWKPEPRQVDSGTENVKARQIGRCVVAPYGFKPSSEARANGTHRKEEGSE